MGWKKQQKHAPLGLAENIYSIIFVTWSLIRISGVDGFQHIRVWLQGPTPHHRWIEVNLGKLDLLFHLDSLEYEMNQKNDKNAPNRCGYSMYSRILYIYIGCFFRYLFSQPFYHSRPLEFVADVWNNIMEDLWFWQRWNQNIELQGYMSLMFCDKK